MCHSLEICFRITIFLSNSIILLILLLLRKTIILVYIIRQLVSEGKGICIHEILLLSILEMGVLGQEI